MDSDIVGTVKNFSTGLNLAVGVVFGFGVVMVLISFALQAENEKVRSGGAVLISFALQAENEKVECCSSPSRCRRRMRRYSRR